MGVQADYWLTNRMALGLNGTAFFGSKTPQYDRIRFQEGLLLTANKTLWQASLDYQYEFIYGKIAVFKGLDAADGTFGERQWLQAGGRTAMVPTVS